MKVARTISLIFALVAFAVAFSLPRATSAEPGHAPTATMTAKAAHAAPAPREPHPEIRDAIRLLGQAQGHLNHAAHDFGGHRTSAMKHIDEALAELHQALQYDKH